MIGKTWNFRYKRLRNEDIVNTARECHIPKTIATILLNRNIAKKDIPSFIKKSMANILNPSLMLDMDKAVARINKAIENKEKITVYGDYDVDGITATALLYEFLKGLGAEAEYYIPDRRSEGYGINAMAVNRLSKQGVKLLITVDCGITAVGEVEFAKLQKMDVIITDHHTCKDRLPTAAAAILNPKRPDCKYPFDSLAGVGVAFKLILALAVSHKMNTRAVFEKYIDLAALGTVADVVPLIGENRIIVDKGLSALQTPQRAGLRAIIDIAGVGEKPVTASTIAFAIAPRLNAAGRLGTAVTAVELLLTKDESRAREIALQLDAENRERQQTEKEIFDEAIGLIAKDADFAKKKIIVLAHEDWHQGVIGIVASRLSDMYYKPCILISCEKRNGKGSGRSIKSFNLFDALNACEKYLTDFGGHAVAAGLNINTDRIEEFTKAINKYADDTLSDKDMIPTVEIDCPISSASVNLNSAKLIATLEPFGMGNEKPIFAISSAEVNAVSAVGPEKKHLRMRIIKNNVPINCIGFGLGDYASILAAGDIIHIAFHMDINSYMGTDSVQLVIKDIRKTKGGSHNA